MHSLRLNSSTRPVKTISVRGNPTIKTLIAVLKATGLKFGVTA